MENIDTLLAAAAETQMLDGEEAVVPTPAGVGLAENSELPPVAPEGSVKVVIPAQSKKPRVAGDKNKRGRASGKPPLSKRIKKEFEEEDVCFICFDGGDLVLCDCKGCPKAYHAACIKRDAAFFQSPAKWYCGWHICSVCRKAAHYLCYTCSYSLCKGCAKDADYSCVRKNRGFCSICMKTIMLLENKGQANNEMIQVDFDDASSWEYLFKAYWVTLKDKLLLTNDELTRAQKHWKDMGSIGCKPPSSNSIPNAVSLAIPVSDSGTELLGTNKSCVDISLEKVNNKDTASPSMDEKTTDIPCIKEEAIHEPGKSLVDVSINQDTEMKCICKNTHEKSILVKEDSQKSSIIPAGPVTVVVPAELNGNSRKRKAYKKSGGKARARNKLNEYAAIDVHNINLIYLQRNLMEKLIEDYENFNNMVIGSIVRIIMSSNDQKEDVHRLVQVVGTTKVDEPYKIGDKTADVKLEVLNLVKKEVVSIDAISNDEFTEDECIRLRQSIRSGLVKQFTVGEVRSKAIALQPVRVNVCLEVEILQLNDLRDQASENGSKKELRGILSKLKRLESPAEHKRRISKIPEIHTDPKMSPNYESEEDTKLGNNGKTADHADTPQNGKKSISSNKKGKEQKIIRAQSRVGEKPDASGSSCSNKHTNQVVTTNSVTDGGDIQPMQSSGLETSTATTVGNSPSSSVTETENVWHYRDPSDKIQGPFSMMQLRKWTTTGLFPADMKVWRSHEQHDSLLLADALVGKFKSASGSSHSEAREEEAIGEICKVTNVNGEDMKPTEGSNDDVSVHSENNSEVVKADESGSWPQCWDLLKDTVDCNSDVNDVQVQACDLPHKMDEDFHHHDPPLDGEKDPTLVTEEKLIVPTEPELQDQSGIVEEKLVIPSESELQDQSGIVEEKMNILSEPELQNQSNIVEEKLVILSEPELQNQSDIVEEKLVILSDPELQNKSDIVEEKLVILSEPELQNQSEIVEEKLIIPSEPELQNQPDIAEHIFLPSEENLMSVNFPQSSNNTESNSVLLAPDPDKSNENENISLLDLFGPTLDFGVPGQWCGYTPTPSQQPMTIELDALSEEYMSDLLAEVESMNFEGVSMPSPASATNFARELEDCKDSDCFSLGEISRKSDAYSCTTGDIQTTSKPQCKPISHNAFDILPGSSVHSSTSCDGETINNAGSSSGQNVALDLVGENVGPGLGLDNVDPGRSITMVQGNINLVTVKGNVNLVLGQGMSGCGWETGQGMSGCGWETGQGTGWANPNLNPSPRNGGGNLPWEGQRMYGGDPREWGGYQGGRPQWGWQPQYGGGGGYQRQIPKGKRVCKFFESGHCKKGAFCDYLHP